jgi:signal transduction histidine kinase
MSVGVAATYAGWLAAGVAIAMWLVLHRALDERREAVARACHELRGPLAAARLGLELGRSAEPPSAAQLRAINLELGRAALALDDLSQAPSGGPLGPAPRDLEWIDLAALAAERR